MPTSTDYQCCAPSFDYISGESSGSVMSEDVPEYSTADGVVKLFDWHPNGSTERTLVENEQQKFHHALQGPYC